MRKAYTVIVMSFLLPIYAYGRFHHMAGMPRFKLYFFSTHYLIHFQQRGEFPYDEYLFEYLIGESEYGLNHK